MVPQNPGKSALLNEHELKLTTRGDREIVLTRTFQAPTSLVYKAMITPELAKRWMLGPPGWSMVNCEIDLKVGGVFRYEWCNSDGTRMGMHGAHREIVPCERIVNTESFDFGCESQSGEQITTTSSAKTTVKQYSQALCFILRERPAITQLPLGWSVALPLGTPGSQSCSHPLSRREKGNLG